MIPWQCPRCKSLKAYAEMFGVFYECMDCDHIWAIPTNEEIAAEIRRQTRIKRCLGWLCVIAALVGFLFLGFALNSCSTHYPYRVDNKLGSQCGHGWNVEADGGLTCHEVRVDVK